MHFRDQALARKLVSKTEEPQPPRDSAIIHSLTHRLSLDIHMPFLELREIGERKGPWGTGKQSKGRWKTE